ncbi:response regulator [Rhizobium sp. YTU87027]|uniref:response regulator n=1 Tax=Rhizobium sp. YTU87027 TaxID=3417741 RepID=UPI003D69625B
MTMQGPPSWPPVLLDLRPPDGSGFSLLRSIRSRDNDLPVIIMTTQDQIGDRMAGMNGGANDFLVKPFTLHSTAASTLVALLASEFYRVAAGFLPEQELPYAMVLIPLLASIVALTARVSAPKKTRRIQ